MYAWLSVHLYNKYKHRHLLKLNDTCNRMLQSRKVINFVTQARKEY